MKFDSKRYKILEMLDDLKIRMFIEQGMADTLESGSKDQLIETVQIMSLHHEQVLSEDSETYYVSKAIVDRIKTDEKLKKSLASLYSDFQGSTGIMLFPLDKTMGGINSATYSISRSKEDDKLFCTVALYAQAGLIMFGSGIENKDEVNYKFIVSSSARDRHGNIPDRQFLDKSFAHYLEFVIYTAMFRHYAENENIVLKPGKKVKSGKVKHMNHSKVPIEVMNVNYFQTSIRSEGFPVTGHFRNQRHGPGFSKVKLVYISDYEKKGYTRKSKVSIKEETQD